MIRLRFGDTVLVMIADRNLEHLKNRGPLVIDLAELGSGIDGLGPIMKVTIGYAETMAQGMEAVIEKLGEGIPDTEIAAMMAEAVRIDAEVVENNEKEWN